MKASDAIKEDNQLDAKMNMITKAMRNRIYPDINVGDMVNILLKYDKFHKEHMPKFSDNKYDVEQLIEKVWVKSLYG